MAFKCGGAENVSTSLVVDDRLYFGPSLCFQDLVLAPLGFVVFAALLARRARNVWKQAQTHNYADSSFWVKLSWIDRSQFIFISLLVVLPLFGISKLSSSDPTSGRKTLFYVSQTFQWIAVFVVTLLEVSRDLVRGASMKSLWLLDVFLMLIRVRVAILVLFFDGITPEDGHLVVDIVYFVCTSLLAVAGLMQNPYSYKLVGSGQAAQYGMFVDNTDSKPNLAEMKGEPSASWMAQMSFSWLTPLLISGWKRQLDGDDLYPLLPDDTMAISGKSLLAAWKLEAALKQKDPKRSALFRSLVDVFWPLLLAGAFFKIINDLVVFLGPLLLQRLIRFVEDGAENRSIIDGVFIALGMFFVKTVESLALNQYFHIGYRVGLQVRSAVTYLVYRKAFLLSAKGRQDFKLGELVSLMSVDAQRLCGTAPFVHQFWSAPIQLIVSIILLYGTVGVSVFAGVLLMVVLIPVNAKISKIQGGLNREIMKLKDQRSNKMDEVLQGIRIIKYFAWERSFRTGVSGVRNQEMELIWKNSMWGIVSSFLWAGTPMLVTLITFLVYTLLGQELKPNIAFTALALFNVMRFPMSFLPMIINMLIESRVALQRLAKFLLAEEIDLSYYANSSSQDSSASADGVEMVRCFGSGPQIRIVQGEFSWAKAKDTEKKELKRTASTLFDKVKGLLSSDPSDVEPVSHGDSYTKILRQVNVEFPVGKLTMLCGPVGSGKSSLIGAILGEMKRDGGEIFLSGKVAYAAQQPWIRNASVKDNILFGSPLDEDRYEKVLDVCCLRQDLLTLTAGDKTEIGEKGINLSGGQKARVGLARAVYQDADIYILDDPLSAVDVHVSKHLFEDCILGFLRGKTRLLVTHQIQYLPQSDSIAVVDNGTVTAFGAFTEISKSHPHLIVEATPGQKKTDSSQGGENNGTENAKPDAKPSDAKTPAKPAEQKKPQSGKLVAAENRAKGTIPLHVWKGYMYSMGLTSFFLTISLFFFSQLLSLLSDAQLSYWSTKMVEHELLKEQAKANGSEMPSDEPISAYFGMYAVLTLVAALSVSVRGAAVAVGCYNAAHKFHDKMLDNVLRSPVSFFDTTPTGWILNRFSSDQYTVDNDLRQNIQMLLMCVLRVFFVAVVIFYVTPIFVVVVIPLGVVYFYVQKFYRQSSRELKRLEAVSKSPIFAQFSETLSGVATIRSYNAQSRFFDHFYSMNDAFSRAFSCNNASNRWLAIRLEFIGNVAVGCAALFAVIWNGDDPSTAGLVGMSVTYALDVTGTLNWAIRTFTQLESNMVSVERLEEYSQLKTEKPEIVESERPAQSWPEQGVVVFDDVQMRYRDELDLALKGITFATKAGEKLGIVGRTGAGKSSLAVALFRICELSGGRIVLDGVDISRIGLLDLRSRLSIIPQDPLLFAGTVASNLDPFQEYKHSDLWDALEKVHLKTLFQNDDAGLERKISEGGTNLSVGQRQLMCLARALLRKARVIIMDEATASVDLQTDTQIQETIRNGFGSSTVLTIAHRLATVMACNRVMVLGEGRVLEIGPPEELSARPGSIFRSMTHNEEEAAEMLK